MMVVFTIRTGEHIKKLPSLFHQEKMVVSHSGIVYDTRPSVEQLDEIVNEINKVFTRIKEDFQNVE